MPLGQDSAKSAARDARAMRSRGWEWRLLFERRDLWVGVFWDRKPDGLHVFLCPIPTVALHAHRRD